MAARRPIFADDRLGENARAAGGRLFKKDEYVVVSHGNPDTMLVFGSQFGADAVASIVRERGDWNGTPVRLVSCSTGKGPFAQNLANILGVPVSAPTDTVWLNPDGSMEVGAEIGDNDGTFVTFLPEEG